jgi:hypothetical protein
MSNGACIRFLPTLKKPIPDFGRDGLPKINCSANSQPAAPVDCHHQLLMIEAFMPLSITVVIRIVKVQISYN